MGAVLLTVENRSGLDYHGYHAYDWTRVDPRLESMARTLGIDGCHPWCLSRRSARHMSVPDRTDRTNSARRADLRRSVRD